MTSASDPRGRMRESAAPFPSLGTRIGATETPPPAAPRSPNGSEPRGEDPNLTEQPNR